MFAPGFSTQILALRPDIVRFLAARRRRCPIQADIEDVAQETYAHILGSAELYRPELGELLPWALGIALNVFRRFARNERRYGNYFSAHCVSAAIAETTDPSPERRAQIQQARGRVTKAIQEMPAKQYLALYLHVVDGLAHIDVAAELRISQSLSKKLVQRAREYLAVHGLDEKTFFAVPPPMVELRARSEPRSSFWRECHDWAYRAGHFASLIAAAAAACAVPGKTIAFARAGLNVTEIVIVQADTTADPDDPERQTTTPKLPSLVVPSRRADKPSSPKVWGKPQGLTFPPRKTRR